MDRILEKYAVRHAPRYTSYPTANKFTDAVDGAMVKSWLISLDPAKPLSICLHVPFCQQVCWYCACNMKLALREKPVVDYAKMLRQEIGLVADALPSRMKVARLHWGGGTPTSMPVHEMKKVMETLHRHFELSPDLDVAFELDPRTFKPGMAKSLAALGTTRASLGVQEFDKTVQETVNRIQPVKMVERVVNELREEGIDQINFDLMYGLPNQTVETLSHTIEHVLRMRPQRIALFGYAHVPWMAKRQRMIDEAALPDVFERHDQAEAAAKALGDAGYVRIGLDHFSLAEDPLVDAYQKGRLVRNFQGYCDDPTESLIGMGSTSISALPHGYYQSQNSVGPWMKSISEGKLPVHRGVAVTQQDSLRRDIINSLMCYMDVDLDAVAAQFELTDASLERGLDACREFEADGLAEITDHRIRLTERGRPFVRLFGAAFDSHLADNVEKRHAVAV